MEKPLLIFVLLFALKLSAQTTLYSENFTYSNGTTSGSGSPAMWTTTNGHSSYFAVRTNRFRAHYDCEPTRTWTSKWIDINTYSNILFFIDLEANNLDDFYTNYVRIYYNLDNGGNTLIFDKDNNFTDTNFEYQIPEGDSVQIVIKIRIDDWGNGDYYFDNILIKSCDINQGTCSVNVDTVLNNSSAILKLQSQASNTSIQWQESYNNSSFSNMNGHTQSTDTTYGLDGEQWHYFRAKVTLNSDVCYEYSNVDSVFARAPFCETSYDCIIQDTISTTNYTLNDDNGCDDTQIHSSTEINVTGTLTHESGNVSNFGVINGGDFHFDTNGDNFCNEGVINVEDLNLTSNSGEFHNYGQINTTGNVTLDGNSGTLVTHCKLEIDGDLTIDANTDVYLEGYITVGGDFTIADSHNGDVILRDSTVIKVTGDVYIGEDLYLGNHAYISCNNFDLNDNKVTGNGSNSSEYSQIVINGTSSSDISGWPEYAGYLDICSLSSADSTKHNNGDLTIGANVTGCTNNIKAVPSEKNCSGKFDASNPLPIELLYFTGKLNSNSVFLEWTTSSEINNDYFTIEKSSDAYNWEKVSNIKGNGNSNNYKYYSEIDNNPYLGTSYYRLKQTDFDGKYTYSKIIAVSNNKNINFNIFPNPTKGIVNIISDEEFNYRIFNSLGKTIEKSIKTSENMKIDIYNDGIYYIQLIFKNKTITRKIIVSN